MIYLILLFAILFFLLAWRRLDWAIMILIAALPAYLIRFSIIGLPSTPLEIMIWGVFLVWIIKNFTRVKNNFLENFKKDNKKFKIRYPFDWEIVLLLFIALAAAGAAGFSPASFGIWKAYFFEPALFFIVVLNVIKGAKGREKILWALAVSALAVSALAIYQKITGQLIYNPLWAAEETRRVVSWFGYPNAVGLYLGPIILVMAGWLAYTVKNFPWSSQDKQFSIFNFQTIFNAKIFKPVFISLVIILSLLSIYFAKSKGALAGVAAGLLVFGLLAGKKIRLIVIIGIIIITVGIAAYQPARKLTLDTVRFKTFSGQIRMVGFEETWKMLKDKRLITGAGLANYQATIAPYHAEGFFVKNDDPDWLKKIRASAEYRKQQWQPLEIYLYPHNIILNFWSELGLAGLLLFIWVIGKYFLMGIHYLVVAGSDPQSRNMGSAKIWISGQARNDRKRWEYLVLGLIGAMVAIIVHGIVDVPYFKNDLAVMFWLLVAMMSLINLERKFNINKK